MAGALICAVLRPQKPEFATAAALAAGIAALVVCSEDIKVVSGAIEEFSRAAGLGGDYSRTLLRACGITVIAEFATQICADAGETALAGRVKLALRLGLMGMALPMLADIFGQAARLLSL